MSDQDLHCLYSILEFLDEKIGGLDSNTGEKEIHQLNSGGVQQKTEHRAPTNFIHVVLKSEPDCSFDDLTR